MYVARAWFKWAGTISEGNLHPLQEPGTSLVKHQSVAKCLTGLAGGHALIFLSSWGCRSRYACKTHILCRTPVGNHKITAICCLIPCLVYICSSPQLRYFLQEDVLPVIWEALGGTEDIPLATVGLLLAFICQADFDATAAFVFWLLDK